MKLNSDHRRLYLDYEGAVSRNRGAVARVDCGALEWTRPPQSNFHELYFKLDGARLKGPYRLRHMGQGIYSFERLKR